MEDYIIKRSRIKGVLLLLLGLCFIWGSISLLVELRSVIGLLCLLFFVPCTIIIGFQTLSTKPWLVLTETGLEFYGSLWRTFHVDWTAILSINYKEVAGYRGSRQKYIVMAVKDREAFLNQYPKWNRWIIKSNALFGIHEEITLSLVLTKGISYTSCIELMKTYHQYAHRK